MKRIHRNTYPFLLLFIFHASLLAFAFYKKPEKKSLLALLFSNIGFAYIFEYIVLNLFQAYRYYPKVLKDRQLDNLFGAILSQAIFVPFTSTFLTAFKAGWKTKLLFGLFFTLVEQLFQKIGVYKQNWWKTIFTFILLPIYFVISDKWYDHLKNGTRFVLFSSLYLCILVTGTTLHYAGAVLGYFRFGLGSIHSWREHFLITPIYAILQAFITIWTVIKGGWRLKVIQILLSSMIDLILNKFKLVKKNFAFPFQNVFLHILMLYVSSLFKDLVIRPK
ncbi:hypothetical protein [Mesobacillus harenae]|uniref:hypothetical protein n=1 Tax=Mesobacillus harenae TaxID=2213203 RepID=UPI0015812395|nr:hypothetical protein [Mesobacillus harenae]